MLEAVRDFLPCATPQSWVDAAVSDLETLLIDHANCEKKAASTAMTLMYRHVDKPDLLRSMSQLAREELLHFQQVAELMAKRGIRYRRIAPSRYATGLREHIDYALQDGLIDVLLIGALIEARSCERFALLEPVLDNELAKFYRNLIQAEARHFTDYLALAETYSNVPVESRLERLREIERQLILKPDGQFRFHSGAPRVHALC